MARRNAGKVRESNLTQRQLKRLLSKKKNSDRRNDAKDWATNLHETLQQVKKDEGS